MATLPSGYTQLTYIANEGNAYINTGFKATADTRVVLDFMPTTIETNTYAMGASGATYNIYLFGLWCRGGGNGNYFSFIYGTNIAKQTVSPTANVRYSLDANKTEWSLTGDDGTSISHSFGTTAAFTSRVLYLFTYNLAGSANNRMLGRVYSCQIYDNDTLVRDFVPCTNASGEVGLFDTVNSVFYASANSSYTFAAGDVVETEVTIVSTDIDYSTLTSDTQPDDSTFTLTEEDGLSSVAVVEGDTVWTRLTTHYSDGTETKQYESETVTKVSETVTYSTSHTSTQPADSTFTAGSVTATNPSDGDTVWKKTVTVFSTGFSYTGYTSSTYSAGSIESSVVTYAVGSTQPDDSSFTYTTKESVPVSEGSTLWTKTVGTYTDGSTTTSYTSEAVTLASTTVTYSTSHTEAQPDDSTFTAASESDSNPSDGDVVWSKTTSVYSTGYTVSYYSSYTHYTSYLAIDSISFSQNGEKGAATGRNLLRHAKDLVTDADENVFKNYGDDDGGTYEGCAVSHIDRTEATSMAEPLYWRSIGDELELNKWYCLSAWVKGSGRADYVLAGGSATTDTKIECVYDNGQKWTTVHDYPLTLTTEWKRRWLKFRFTQGPAGGLLRFRCKEGAELYITQPKLEEGEEPTAFCVNEDDLKGSDGTSVSRVSDAVAYAISASGTTAPTSGWQTAVPETTSDSPYLWTRCTTTFTSGDPLVSYSVSRQGSDGVTITSTKTYYVVQNSDHYTALQADDIVSENITSVPQLQKGDYLWSCTVTSYSDDNKTYTVACSRIGDDGAVGAGVHIAYAKDSAGTNFLTSWFEGATYIGVYVGTEADDPTDYSVYKWSRIKGEKGDAGNGISTADVVYCVSSSNTSAPTDAEFYDNGYTLATDALVYGNACNYLWQATHTTYTDSKEAYLGKICLGAVDSFATGTEQYGVSASDSVEPTAWEDNNTDNLTKGKGTYLWTRTKLTYTDGITDYTKAICIGYWGTDGEAGKSIEVRGQATGVSETLASAPSGTDTVGKKVLVTTAEGGYIQVWTYLENDGWDVDHECEDGEYVFDTSTKTMYKVSGDGDTTTQTVAVYTPTDNIGFLVDGHLWFWSSDQGKWTDAGQVQGPQGDAGKDGQDVITLVVDPDSVVWAENLATIDYDSDADQLVVTKPTTAWDSLTLTARVVKGTAEMTVTSLEYSLEDGTALTVAKSGNTFTLSDPTGTWVQGAITITAKGTGFELKKTIPIALNRAGTWQQVTANDFNEFVSTRTTITADGKVQTLKGYITQMADNLSFYLTKDGLKTAGLEIAYDDDTKTSTHIELMADKTKIVDTDNNVAALFEDGKIKSDWLSIGGTEIKSNVMTGSGFTIQGCYVGSDADIDPTDLDGWYVANNEKYVFYGRKSDDTDKEAAYHVIWVESQTTGVSLTVNHEDTSIEIDGVTYVGQWLTGFELYQKALEWSPSDDEEGEAYTYAQKFHNLYSSFTIDFNNGILQANRIDPIVLSHHIKSVTGNFKVQKRTDRYLVTDKSGAAQIILPVPSVDIMGYEVYIEFNSPAGSHTFSNGGNSVGFYDLSGNGILLNTVFTGVRSLRLLCDFDNYTGGAWVIYDVRKES